MGELSVDDVRRRLELSEKATTWLERAATLDTGPALELPDDAEAAELLDRLGVRAEDRAEVLANRPDPVGHPTLWWLLERAHREQLATMGETEMLWWPTMPASLGALGRNAYVWVFLAGVPAARAYHAERGIPDDVSWESLGDLGQQMSVHRRIFGAGGLHTQWWLTLAFRGVLYGLGRLQFNRGVIWFDDAPAPDGVTAPKRDEFAVGLHIPERGSMDPDECERSIERAREFFARHFPEEPVRWGTCVSWLLDDQLAEYLPATSNIVAFQRRFHLVPPLNRSEWDNPPAWTSGDKSMLEFVFRRMHEGPDYPTGLVDSLPRETSLQRAFVDHLRAGRHWWGRAGWFPM